ncbi:soluble scavenger receptor cysteine-rich domain-containing protein SSC5D-like [Lates japonicus]|uniref:Soluble scavenger receptor cysteine-rich domain-containing protein SSC5D-like protein n=1 Tax=Lates japonicus TaxID=270547 RepID=A0AAD3NGN3_LATJO|nr:soluble scavenger receptor cysteine-rich domain-containing protein SSC5D-like protein [Lates japonicus]
MNPYGDRNLNSRPRDVTDPPPYSAPGPYDNSHNPPLPAVIQTGHSSLMVLSHNSPPYQASSDRDGGQNLVQSPHSDRSALALPGSGLRSMPPVLPQAQTPSPASIPALNPYPAPATPPSSQVSVIIPSPDLRPSPLPLQCSEDSCPDLECSICFSQFNNVFRCPKMLHCKHTFCLECLARINVKSPEPSAIQCPLCRSLTPLPTLGLPKLTTDPDVLSYLPAAMQRVYSIRFLRNKGKLEVKRSAESHRRWGQRSLTSLRSVNRSLDVGLPSPPVGGGGEAGGVGGALFRLTGRPACRAFLLTSVVMMMVLLTGIIIFLFTVNKGSSSP